MDSPLRLVGYIRVSTEDQALHGVSLDAQRTRLRAYAKAHGHQLVRIEVDDGVSGKVKPLKRTGLSAALASVRGREADGLVFLKLDRLSRSVRHVLDIADDAKRQGWHLLSVSEHIDTSTAAGKFTLGVLGLLAEMEREQIAERTRFGMAELQRQGRARSRFLPFGYRVRGAAKATALRPGGGRELVEHADEQALLRRMLRAKAKGLGAQRIAGVLNKAGATNPRTKLPWSTGTVAAILRTAARRERSLA